MRQLKYLLAVSLFFTSLLMPCRAEDAAIGGLLLQYEDNPDLRSSYEVFNQPQEPAKDSLIIQFQALLRGSDQRIGHILTCFSENDQEFFNVILKQIDFDTPHPELSFNLNVKPFKSQLVITLPEEALNEKWFDVKIRFDYIRHEVSLSIDGQVQTRQLEPIQWKRKEPLRYIFGRCNHYVDLHPFAIKDLSIQSDRMCSHFPLDESEGTVVHSLDGKKTGTVLNPAWLYDTHIKWEEQAVIEEDEIAAVYHDSEKGQVVLCTSKSIYTYNLARRTISSESNANGQAFKLNGDGGCNYLFLPESRQLVLYNKNSDGEPVNLILYDPDRQTILNTSHTIIGDRYHQASAFRSKDEKYLYEFGGYASFQYHNHFKRLDLESFNWEDIEFGGDQITPRFYTSITHDFSGENERVWLYGGYGNPVGSQDFGGEYYHDLYEIDLARKEIRKLTDFKTGNFDQIPCRDLVAGDDGHSFYTFCYPQYLAESTLQLYRFDWKDQTVTPYAAAIPFLSEQIMTQVSLFEDSRYNCMICVLQEFEDLERSHIKIYRINTPVLPQATVAGPEQAKGTPLWVYALTILIALAVATAGILLARRRRNTGRPSPTPATAIPEQEAGPEAEQTVDTEALKEINQPQPTVTEAVKQNSIYLLGDFTVFDKSGNDITHLFSAKIRQLFLLIFMHTYRTSSLGISSKEISCIMWPEKEVSESKNIRGVTIKYLRDALADVEGIAVVSRGGKWFIDIDQERCHCDYLVLRNADLSDLNEYDDMRPYVHMLRRGNLLKSENYDWLDTFKAEYEEQILGKMNQKMNQAFENAYYLTSYKISQVLLTIAPLDEELMKIEINSLIKLGDPVKAKVKFRQFSVNYYEAYEESLRYEDYVN